MATETLYVTSVPTPGALVTSANAVGAPNGVFTENVDNTPWTATFDLGNPVGNQANGTHTITLRVRKETGTGTPTVATITLYAGATSLGAIGAGNWSVTSTTGEDVAATFAASLLSGYDLSTVAVEVATTAVGGGGTARTAVQLDAITWSGDFTTVSNFTTTAALTGDGSLGAVDPNAPLMAESDDFERTDIGAGWRVYGAGVTILTGAVTGGTTTSAMCRETATSTDNQVSRMVYAGGSVCGVSVQMPRAAGGTNVGAQGAWYTFRMASASTMNLFRKDVDVTSSTTLATAYSYTPTAGDVFEVTYSQVAGVWTLRGYVNRASNPTPVIEHAPASPLTGQRGVGTQVANATQSTVRIIESWSGGDIQPTDFTRTVALSGEGSLEAVAVGPRTVDAALTGSGTLGVAVPAGEWDGPWVGADAWGPHGQEQGTATLSGSGALTTVRTVAFARTVTLSGDGSLTASQTAAVAQPVALTGSGTLAAAGSPAWAGAVGLSGSGTLTTTQAPRPATTAALTGSGSLTAAQAPAAPTTTALTGSGTLTTVQRVTASATATLTGGGALTGTPGSSAPGSATLTGSGTLTTTSTPRPTSTAALSGSGTLSSTTKPALPATATLTGTGSLSAGGAGTSGTSAALTGAGSLTATGRAALTVVVALAGSGSLGATAAPAAPAGATLAGAGSLTTTAVVAVAIAIALTGSGDLTAEGSIPLPGVKQFTATASLRTRTNTATAGARRTTATLTRRSVNA